MRYSPNYEEIQSCSPRFRDFQTALVRQLIEKYHLRGKRIVEIGCGKGDFLRELCREAQANGIGIDPSYRAAETSEGESVRFLREFYGPQHADLEAEFICCRHTLEHIPDPLAFLQMIVSSLKDRRDVVVCFEVPDMERVLRDGAFWDVYYEHCSYFTSGTIARLFRKAGLEVLDVYKEFDDQYLLIEGRLGDDLTRCHANEESHAAVQTWTHDFQHTVTGRLNELTKSIDDRIAEGKQVVFWGGGSKAVSLLTSLNNRQAIQHVVDINPVKQGKFVPGAGLEVIAPQRLSQLRPDVVVVMNGIYCREIASMLAEMQLAPELISL